MNETIQLPRWVVLLILVPSCLVCLVLAFCVIPQQERILKETQQQNREIEENRQEIEQHKKSIERYKDQIRNDQHPDQP